MSIQDFAYLKNYINPSNEEEKKRYIYPINTWLNNPSWNEDISTLRKIHVNICKQLIRETLDDDVYLGFDHGTFDKDAQYLRVTIFTNEMLEYDRVSLNAMDSEGIGNPASKDGNPAHSLSAKNVYLPYFIHFLIDLNEISDTDMKEELRKLSNEARWCHGKISREKPDGDAIRGLIEIGIRDITYRSGWLSLLNERSKEDKINKIAAGIVCGTDDNVGGIIKGSFNESGSCFVKVYKVGNGNLLYITDAHKGKIIYDIGYSTGFGKPTNNKQYSKASRAISHMKPACVMLSHWDCDHFIGYVYAKQEMFYRPWIAPDLCVKPYIKGRAACLTARRLAVYLYKIGSLHLIARGNSTGRLISMHTSGKLTLSVWLGGNKDPNTSLINCEGLALDILYNINNTNNIHTLMMGDVPYVSLPAASNFKYNSPFDYLVVPHHGGKLVFSPLMKHQKDNLHYAIVSGDSTRPVSSHKSALNNGGYNVVLTEQTNEAIRFNLHRKNEIRMI